MLVVSKMRYNLVLLQSFLQGGGKDFSFDEFCKVIQHVNNHPGKYGYTEEEIRDAFKVSYCLSRNRKFQFDLIAKINFFESIFLRFEIS